MLGPAHHRGYSRHWWWVLDHNCYISPGCFPSHYLILFICTFFLSGQQSPINAVATMCLKSRACCCLLASLIVLLDMLHRPASQSSTPPPSKRRKYNVLVLILCFFSGSYLLLGQPHVCLSSAVCRYDPSSTKCPNKGSDIEL